MIGCPWDALSASDPSRRQHKATDIQRGQPFLEEYTKKSKFDETCTVALIPMEPCECLQFVEGSAARLRQSIGASS